MTTRLMTPFCFASMLAALLVAEGALGSPFPGPGSLTQPENLFVPPEPSGELAVDAAELAGM